MDIEQQSILVTCLDALRHPGQLIWGGLEYLNAWRTSRRWWSMAFFSLPVIIAISVFSVALFGRIRRPVLLEQYLVWVQERVELAEQTKQEPEELLLFEQQDLDAATELMLERILYLDELNSLATYLVAGQLAQQQRFGQARYMMRQIAPSGGRGFLPAHAWLAADRLSRFEQVTASKKSELVNDLEQGVQWEGSTSLLVSAYADLLIGEGRLSDALAILEAEAEEEPRLWLKVAFVAKQGSRSDRLDNAIQKIQSRVDPLIASGEASAGDYADAARIHLLMEQFDEAIRFGSLGLTRDPEEIILKRTISEAFRFKYLATSEEDAATRIRLLDSALKADSSNPAVSEEIARLVAAGSEMPVELEELLQQVLAEGSATSLTHVLLASREFNRDDFPKAITHLEIALRITPNSPVVLNNLGVALSRTHPDDDQMQRRAELLLQRALQITGPDAELLDSLGEIRINAGKIVEAVQCFEASVGLDASRLKTRRRLIDAYKEIGLDDMAKIQSKLIESAMAQTQPTPGDSSNAEENEQE